MRACTCVRSALPPPGAPTFTPVAPSPAPCASGATNTTEGEGGGQEGGGGASVQREVSSIECDGQSRSMAVPRKSANILVALLALPKRARQAHELGGCGAAPRPGRHAVQQGDLRSVALLQQFPAPCFPCCCCTPSRPRLGACRLPRASPQDRRPRMCLWVWTAQGACSLSGRCARRKPGAGARVHEQEDGARWRHTLC